MTDGPFVHIVDDDPDVLESLSLALTASGYACKTYDSGGAFLQQAAPTVGDCAIFDFKMPRIDGVGLLEEVARREWRLPVIVMTAFGDIPLAVRAVRAGAMDFVEKPCAVPALRWVIDRALAEAKKGISGHADIDDTARLNRLTVREREVFDLLAKGDTNKGVGRTLDISARTVETHRARVMEKLELRNLAELVRLAQRAATVEGMRDPAS